MDVAEAIVEALVADVEYVTFEVKLHTMIL
jgi:hypothetical protein